ncbi:MAG TPA: CsiV family protein [Verrucomicrobiae bacterium]|nr:CsiV family protein [Verrucomicrobiae bacterium]
MKTLSRLCLTLALLTAPGTVLAERYRVDLIVFIDRSAAAGESTQQLKIPDVTKALEPYEAVPLRNQGIEILPDESFGMTEEWSRLRNSRNHQPILRLAWLQADPPTERGHAIRLHWGNAFTQTAGLNSQRVYPVDGSVALLAGRYLHVDAELVYTQSVEGGEYRSFVLDERRRVRRDEVHHLDSPRLGVLVRATRADGKKK